MVHFTYRNKHFIRAITLSEGIPDFISFIGLLLPGLIIGTPDAMPGTFGALFLLKLLGRSGNTTECFS
jgi:hypothetical protein